MNLLADNHKLKIKWTQFPLIFNNILNSKPDETKLRIARCPLQFKSGNDVRGHRVNADGSSLSRHGSGFWSQGDGSVMY